MTRLMSRDRPYWLRDGAEDEASEKYRRTIHYHRQAWQATPPWLSDEHRAEMRSIWKRKKELRRQGLDVHVDHIVPLTHELVCGLHVPWNLQIMEAGPNMSKGNKWWPNHPFENGDLLGHELDPHQLRLL